MRFRKLVFLAKESTKIKTKTMFFGPKENNKNILSGVFENLTPVFFLYSPVVVFTQQLNK